jgi:hypothetical protein
LTKELLQVFMFDNLKNYMLRRKKSSQVLCIYTYSLSLFPKKNSKKLIYIHKIIIMYILLLKKYRFERLKTKSEKEDD